MGVSFQNTLVKVELNTHDVIEFSYDGFVQYVTNEHTETSTIDKIQIYPNGDDTMKILCGNAPMWKKHESKEAFEEYYTLSEMKRTLYANEYEADGNPVPIYVDINGEKIIATWESTLKPILAVENPTEDMVGVNDMFDDKFTYRKATLEECGILNILGSVMPVKISEVFSDSYRLLNTPNFIVVEDESITLKQHKSIIQRMLYHGFAQHNVKFNVEV